jgi:mitogen-activated protein kinase organizer 1
MSFSNNHLIIPIIYNVPIINPISSIKNNDKDIKDKTKDKAIYVIKFSNDGDYCMTGSQEKSIKLYNPFKKQLIKSYDNIHNNDVLDLTIAKDNTKFASVGLDKSVYLTDSIKCTVLRRFNGHLDRINSINFNNDESILLSGSHDCSVRLWDLKSHSREPIQTLIDSSDSISRVLCNDNQITSISVDGNLRIYDIRIGKLLKYNLNVTLNGIDISSDGNYYCISGIDDCIRFIEISSGKILKVFAGLHKSKNYSKVVKFSQNDSGVFITSENNDIVYYDLVDEKKDKIFRGHTKISSGFDINLKKDGIGISSGFDGNIFLWNFDK